MHHVLQSPSLEMIFEEFITSLLNKKSYGPIKARRIPLLLNWFSLLCLFNDNLYSMTGFRSRDETFGSCPEDSSRVTFQLIISSRLKQSLNDQLAHQGS